jgi:Tol biopolymer transport system component
VALFPNGDLLTFVSGGSDDLVRLNPEGQEVSRFKSVMSAVYGEDEPEPAPWNVRLAVDSSERMLVFHKADSQVFIFEPDGRYSTRFTDENLFFPRDIAVDGKGRIYVSHGSGVKVFDYTGRVLGEIALENHDSVEAMEITSKGELLMVLGNEVVAKYVLQEP